jgi:hypothetical protein
LQDDPLPAPVQVSISITVVSAALPLTRHYFSVLLIMGYQIFNQDKKLFVGVNAIAIPSIPEAQQDLPERPENITQICWAIDAPPQLPFMLPNFLKY